MLKHLFIMVAVVFILMTDTCKTAFNDDNGLVRMMIFAMLYIVASFIITKGII